jgi:hypothetical protein
LPVHLPTQLNAKTTSDLTVSRTIIQLRNTRATPELTTPPPTKCDVGVESFDEEIIFHQCDESMIYMKEPPAYGSTNGISPKCIWCMPTLKSLPQRNGQVIDHPPSVHLNSTPSASHCTLGGFLCSSDIFPWNS